MNTSTAIAPSPPSQHAGGASWAAWVARNRDEETRARFRDDLILDMVLIGAFTAAALFGGHVLEYEFAVGATLAVVAAIGAFRAINASRYMSAVVFASLAIVYNPALPVVALSGPFALAVLLLSAGAVTAMLVWRRRIA